MIEETEQQTQLEQEVPETEPFDDIVVVRTTDGSEIFAQLGVQENPLKPGKISLILNEPLAFQEKFLPDGSETRMLQRFNPPTMTNRITIQPKNVLFINNLSPLMREYYIHAVKYAYLVLDKVDQNNMKGVVEMLTRATTPLDVQVHPNVDPDRQIPLSSIAPSTNTRH